MKVLLVEDDRSLREGLTELLSELADVVPVSSYADALRELDRHPFALVFSDLRLAGSKNGGREIVIAARERLTPVVIVSAMSRTDIERAMEGQLPDEIVTKPFQLEDALGVTERFLRLRRDLDRLATDEPPPAAFVEVEPGARVAIVSDGPHGQVRWYRLARACRTEWTPRGPELSLIVDGGVEANGRWRQKGGALYAPASERVSLFSPEGVLAVALTLRPIRRRR